MSDIVVVGSLNFDISVLADRMPAGGETVHGTEYTMAPGGKGGNQAVAIARLGGDVAMVGQVGRDGFGEMLKKSLSDNRVNIEHVKEHPGKSTGVALIVVEKNGENRIIVVSGANWSLTEHDIDAVRPLLQSARMVLLQFEIPMPVIKKVICMAHEAGVSVMVNAAPAYPIDAEILACIDYLVMNEHETEVISGMKVQDKASAQAAAKALVERGVKCAIITLGNEGAVAACPDLCLDVPPYKVEPVDTTAAGDAFIGGLAVMLLNPQKSLYEKIRFANAVGAMTATKRGAQSSLPALEEVNMLYRS